MMDLSRLDYITDEAPAPDTVNPSLWRQSQVIRRGGLYKVTDGLYQARNNDIANLTIVEGDAGLVIIDCTASVEAARQGMDLFREHVSDKPVVAVIYTHTHIDHYGGVKGVVDPADVASGKVPVIAPGTIASFDKYAIGENVVAGNAMSRRAAYAFGEPARPEPERDDHLRDRRDQRPRPRPSPTSRPTDGITQTGTRRDIAGLTFEFLLRAGHRGAGGDAHLDPAAQGADLRGERQPLAAQHPDAARRPDPRRPQLRPLPG